MGGLKQRAGLRLVLDKRTQNTAANKERTIISLKNNLQETCGCCSVVSCWLLCSAYSSPSFFFFPPTKTLCTQGPREAAAASLGVALTFSRERSSKMTGQRVPCQPHRGLENMFVSSQQEAAGLVTPPPSLSSSQGCWKEQCQSPGPRSRLSQVLLAV